MMTPQRHYEQWRASYAAERFAKKFKLFTTFAAHVQSCGHAELGMVEWDKTGQPYDADAYDRFREDLAEEGKDPESPCLVVQLSCRVEDLPPDFPSLTIFYLPAHLIGEEYLVFPIAIPVYYRSGKSEETT